MSSYLETSDKAFDALNNGNDLSTESKQKLELPLKFMKSSFPFLERLIGLFHNFVKVLADGRDDLNPEKIDVEDLADEIREKYNRAYFVEGFKINVLLSGKTKYKKKFWIDKEKVFEVLDNLIGNACEYLSKHPDKEKTIVIAMRAKKDHIEMEIYNQGKLADPEKLFEDGYTGNKGKKPRGQGMGIVKYLLESMGGTIDVDNIERAKLYDQAKCFVNLKARNYVRSMLKLENLNPN